MYRNPLYTNKSKCFEEKLYYFFIYVYCSLLSVVVTGVPVPDNEVAFYTTTVRTNDAGLVEVHKNLSSVCVSMLPVHGNHRPQNSSAPYIIKTNSLKVAPGGTLEGEQDSYYLTYVKRTT